MAGCGVTLQELETKIKALRVSVLGMKVTEKSDLETVYWRKY